MLNKIKTHTPVELKSFLEKFHLKKIYKYSGHSLSGGERQRVNIAMTLINSPKILFLDELTTGIDVKSKKDIFNILNNYSNDSTKIFISHDMMNTQEFCDRVIYLEHGKLLADEKMDVIIKNYGSLENFLTEKLEKAVHNE